MRSEGHAIRHFNRHHFSAGARDGATRQIASVPYVPTHAEEDFLGSPELTLVDVNNGTESTHWQPADRRRSLPGLPLARHHPQAAQSREHQPRGGGK